MDVLRLVSALSQHGSWSRMQCPRCALPSTEHGEAVVFSFWTPDPVVALEPSLNLWDGLDSLTSHLEASKQNPKVFPQVNVKPSPHHRACVGKTWVL